MSTEFKVERIRLISGSLAALVIPIADSPSATHPAGTLGLSSTGKLYKSSGGGSWTEVGDTAGLSGTINSAIVSLSGTINARFVSTNPLKAYRTSTVAIANTETVMLSYTVPANTLAVGSLIRFVCHGSRTGAVGTSPTVRVRVGPTTLTGAIVISQGNVATTNTGGWHFEGSVIFTAVGASGNAVGDSWGAINSSATNTVVINMGRIDAVTVDTTVSNLVEITLISGDASNTYTVRGAQLWQY